MIIDGNKKELEAMEFFRKGDRETGLKVQKEFVDEFCREYQDKDHCSCQKACRYHGRCRECVAIHRAHMDHLPNCFHPMVNQRISSIAGLTETNIN